MRGPDETKPGSASTLRASGIPMIEHENAKMMERDDSRAAATMRGEFRSLIKGVAGAQPLVTAHFLPHALARLPAGDPRRRRAVALIAEQRTRERAAGATSCAPLDLLEPGERHVLEQAELCMRLSLLTNPDPALDDLRFVLEWAAEPVEGRGTPSYYLEEVGAAGLEDLTAAQRWELIARTFELDSYCGVGELFNAERALLGRPLPFVKEGVH
jgi:hypothetical protein